MEFWFIKPKNLFMKSIKFVLLNAITILFFTFSSDSSFSQSLPENYVRTEAANKVQFMGIEDDLLIFDLRFSEMPAKGCTLQILDAGGNVIFEELISGNPFKKRYKVVKEAMPRISFKASAKGFSYNQSFTIKTEERLVVTVE
jgi:hypothetical protein